MVETDIDARTKLVSAKDDQGV